MNDTNYHTRVGGGSNYCFDSKPCYTPLRSNALIIAAYEVHEWSTLTPPTHRWIVGAFLIDTYMWQQLLIYTGVAELFFILNGRIQNAPPSPAYLDYVILESWRHKLLTPSTARQLVSSLKLSHDNRFYQYTSVVCALAIRIVCQTRSPAAKRDSRISTCCEL